MRLAVISFSLVGLCAGVLSDVTERDDPPTWAKDVAPLVHANCTVCHTANGHGPFALERYEDVRRRWELFRQVTLSLQMPPCGFTSDFGDFCLTKPLTDAQIVMLQDWFRAEMPRGTSEPEPPVSKPGFRLGAPDLVLRSPAVPDVPKEGNPVWRAVVLDLQREAPLRLRAFDLVPQDAKAVRHVLLAVLAPGVSERAWATAGTLDDKAGRLIGAWAPGYPAWQLPPGTALTVQPGEKLVAQVLFQTTGRNVPPTFDLGLYAARGDHHAREARWITREVKDFQLRPYTEQALTTTVTLDRDVDLLAVVPEARFFAYVLDIKARTGGEEKRLLHTIRWIPYWNGSFVFRNPVELKKGDEIVSRTVYENQPHSPINEGNRPRYVFSGAAIDQEVCRTHYLVVDRAGR